MSENLVSAEAREQTAALDLLRKDMGYFMRRYPKQCQRLLDQLQFEINRTERSARLAYVEEQVRAIIIANTGGE
jgi:hypothetical protein